MLTFAFRDESLLYEHWLCFPPQTIPHQETVPLIDSIIRQKGQQAGFIFPLSVPIEEGGIYMC